MTNEKKLEKVAKDCEQLVATVAALKSTVDSLMELSDKLSTVADIHEKRLNYEEYQRERSLW